LSPEGKKRVASFLKAVDREVADTLLSGLTDEEQTALREEMGALPPVDSDLRTEVFTAFARDVEKVLAAPQRGEEASEAGNEKASRLGRLAEELRLPEPDAEAKFSASAKLAAEDLARVLSRETPQAVAYVLSLMDAATAAVVVEALPEQAHGEVVTRMVALAAPCELLVPIVDQWIAHQAEEPEEEAPAAPTEGDAGEAAEAPLKKTRQHKIVAKLLGALDTQARDAALEQLAQVDQRVADLVRSLMFLFEDLPRLADRAIHLLLREVGSREIALTLKTAPEPVREKILQNVSKRAAEMINDEVEMLGDRPSAEVEKAKREIAQTAVRLADQGAIELPKDDEEGAE